MIDENNYGTLGMWCEPHSHLAVLLYNFAIMNGTSIIPKKNYCCSDKCTNKIAVRSTKYI